MTFAKIIAVGDGDWDADVRLAGVQLDSPGSRQPGSCASPETTCTTQRALETGTTFCG